MQINAQNIELTRFSSGHEPEDAKWIEDEAKKLGVRPSLFIRLKMRQLRQNEQQSALPPLNGSGGKGKHSTPPA